MEKKGSIKDAAREPYDLYLVGRVQHHQQGRFPKLWVELADTVIAAKMDYCRGSLPRGLERQLVELIGYAENSTTMRVREVRRAGEGAGPVTTSDWRLAFVDQAAGLEHVRRYPGYLV